jgi:hypothetical protein
MLFFSIVNYSTLSCLQLYKLSLVILSYFILVYFRLREAIIDYFWLLKVISPYVIIDNFKLL